MGLGRELGWGSCAVASRGGMLSGILVDVGYCSHGGDTRGLSINLAIIGQNVEILASKHIQRT